MIKNKRTKKKEKKNETKQKNTVIRNHLLDNITNHPTWLQYFRITFEYHAQ